MLVSFTKEEVMVIGRAVAQGQEGIASLSKYLERAIPEMAMNAVNAPQGDGKLRGAVLAMEDLRSTLVNLPADAERISREISLRGPTPEDQKYQLKIV